MKSFFVQRFLVQTEYAEARPAGLRYDSALGLTLGPDGSVFVKYANPGDSATETRRHGCERDRATTMHRGAPRETQKDEAARRLARGEVAMRRAPAAERPVSFSRF